MKEKMIDYQLDMNIAHAPVSEEVALKIHAKILHVFDDYRMCIDNGKIYIVNVDSFDDDIIPEILSYEYLQEYCDLDKIEVYDSYADALSAWLPSIEADIVNMGLLNEAGKWNFYLTPDEIAAIGISEDIISLIRTELGADRYAQFSEASEVLEEAIQIGMITEDPKNPENIFVLIVYDNGLEMFESINKLEAIIDMVNQNAVDMLKAEIQNVKDNGYQKNINTFCTNITKEDVDVYNKLINLHDGTEISDEIFNIFSNNDELQDLLAEKIVESVKSDHNVGNGLTYEMERFSGWYDDDYLKNFDYRDALYNMDDLFLKKISECIGVPIEELDCYGNKNNLDDVVLDCRNVHDNHSKADKVVKNVKER